MKKLLLLITLIAGLSFLFADLEVDMSFSTNFVGDEFTGTVYTFESPHFDIINTGATATYNFSIVPDGMPDTWMLLWCNNGMCHPYTAPATVIEMEQNVAVDFDVSIANISSNACFHFEMIVTDVNENTVLTIPFTFQTEGTGMDIDIPFETVINAGDFISPVLYEPGNISLTNHSQTETFNISIESENLPIDWNLTWEANGTTYNVNEATDFSIENEANFDFDFALEVNSVGSVDYTLTINSTAIPMPIIQEFSYENSEASATSESVVNFNSSLNQNYPNPFNPITEISFNLSAKEAIEANLVIYNLLGQEIKTFTDLTQGSVLWNGTDNLSNPVGSGVYFYKFNKIENNEIRKMILIK